MKYYLYIFFIFSFLFSSENTFLKDYTIDENGRITSWQKKNGIILYYSYDSKDRLTELKSSDGSIYYVYKYEDSIDPIEIEDVSTGEKIWRKFSKNHLIYEKTSHFILQKTFDESERLSEIIYPDSSSVRYIYDEENLKVQRIGSNNELLYFHEYRPSKAFLEETLINGAIQRTFFENTEIREKINPYLSYKLQKNNKEEKISSNLGETIYEFNKKNELVKEKGVFDITYSYDYNYNRLSQNNVSYEYNQENQLISQNNTLYAYDPNGNLIQEKAEDHLRYFYDALDRLVCIICKEKYKLEFTYDALSRRTSRTKYFFSGDAWQKTEGRFFIYDDFNEIGALDEKGEIIELKVGGKSDPLFSRPIAIELNHIPYTPIFDLRNNLSALVLSDKIIEYYCYSGFGMEKKFDENLMEIPLSKLSNPWSFSLKRKDASLIFFGKRFYNPNIGRWITSDPCGCIDSSNLYTYALNDPIHRIDLYGLSSFSVELQKIFFYLCRQTGSIAFSFASFLDYLNHEIVAFPFINKVFGVGVNFIQFCYSPWEIEPYTYLLEPLGKNNPKLRFGYVNGICNICPQECIDSGATILEKFAGDAQLDLYYSASHGCLIDYLECVFLKLNIETPNTERFKELLRENLKKVEKDGKYILFVHSKSAIMAKIAISQLTDAEKAKIEIYASAPFELLNKDLCSSVKNVLSLSDGISLFNAYEILKSKFSEKVPLEWIDPIEAIFPSDHFYHSLSYQLRLKKQMEEILKRFDITSKSIEKCKGLKSSN